MYEHIWLSPARTVFPIAREWIQTSAPWGTTYALLKKNCSVNLLHAMEIFRYALERENIVSFDEMCRQLAFYRSGDIANFDVIVLVYTLLAYFETSQSFYLSSFARGVVPLTNIKLIESALKVVGEDPC